MSTDESEPKSETAPAHEDPGPERASEGDPISEESAPFAVYLAKRLLSEGYRQGMPVEAETIVDACHLALHYPSFGLVMAAIIDRERDPKRTFDVDNDALQAIGKACAKYAGTINGAQIPVGLTIYEVAAGPPSEEDRERMRRLQRTKTLRVTPFHLDTTSQTVFCPSAWNGLFRGRGKVESILRSPRISDAELFKPAAAIPKDARRPIATLAVLGALIVGFALEHLYKLSEKGTGLLGLDPATLFAVGGMNADAVRKDGEYYRMVSAALLHGDLFHLFLNGVALFLGGMFLESMIGRGWFLTLMLLGAIGGSALGALVNPSNIVSVGASGAIMGLLAASLVLAWRFPKGPERVQIQVQMAQFLVPSLIPLATHRAGGQVDYAAHIGGAATGALFGLLILALWPKDALRPKFSRFAQGMGVVAALVFAASAALAARDYDKYAPALASAAQGLLIQDDKIPKDEAEAKRTVEEWGKDFPRDPRVHLYRAMRLLDENKPKQAESELRALLAEREILDRDFNNRKLEIFARSILCELLLADGRKEEAKRDAAPVCTADNGKAPEYLKSVGLCP